ncbi:hypothetical protein [Ruegeria sp. HKCCD8929]|uniref:hypothetical protein n=1 Tax=Ruegeria sp. HKCCD8929 TaxID=2683006 RepID=UPI0014886C74|nr:hypothetical protein [Ruegeria sp. HKCCD8929]
MRPRARPKQNENLEETIKRLGAVFERYSGRKPMDSYWYNDLDEERPYKGSFFDFLFLFFWVDDAQRNPSVHAIGNVARRLFGHKK